MSLDTLLDQVRNTYDIVEVVSSFVNLKKAGRNYVGFCPFHSESKPSFTVSPEKQIFKCFGCNSGGDVVTFYMKMKGLSFREALLELAEKAGLVVEKKFSLEKEKIREKELVEFNYRVAKFYHQLLFIHSSSELALSYLRTRGLREETLKTFLIGFAPFEGRVLASYLRGREEDLKKAEELGLIKRVEDGSYLDLFRGRIVFPIFNSKGECIGFGGRALEKDIEPKYLNTPDSKIYKKSEALYGLYQAKEFIKREQEGFIVEGYFDFLSLWERGIKNVIASCGTALTEKHLKILKPLAKNWNLFYDGDLAGKKATLRTISLFLKESLLPKIVVLPEGEDPDSWIRSFSLDIFSLKKEITSYTVEAMSFVIEYFKKDLLKNPSQVFKEIVEIFKPIEDPILKSKIVKDLSFYLEIPENEIWKSLSNTKGLSEKRESSFMSEEKEEYFLKVISQFLVNFPEYFPELISRGLLTLLEDFADSIYAQFLVYFYEEFKLKRRIFELWENSKFQEIFSELLLAPPFENPEEVFSQIKDYLVKQVKKREIKKIVENLRLLEIKGKKEEIERYLWLVKNSLNI
ncbi:MAG: DNA primase [Thermodesulfobacteriaceae bacterium]|nr:DNA primase [Thermodesulfobacteriaceae bacterium]MDW8135843.1 DNA primase [Thermodesulfobacterium sp.]